MGFQKSLLLYACCCHTPITRSSSYPVGHSPRLRHSFKSDIAILFAAAACSSSSSVSFHTPHLNGSRFSIAMMYTSGTSCALAFTPALAKKMAKAGCIAVTGGLECANDRLLALMKKGITLASAEKVLRAFRAAKIFVHAYLMYDFPTETKAEQRGAERYVRSLARKGLIQSCYWHRFALTVHSPIAREPEKFGIIIKQNESKFAKNELEYERSR